MLIVQVGFFYAQKVLMAKTYTVTVNNNPPMFKDVTIKESAKTYEIDFSPWAEDNNTVTTVTWTNSVGQATISGQALASNVASALITFSQAGNNLIKIKADTGTEIYIAYLNVQVNDPSVIQDEDYGLII